MHKGRKDLKSLKGHKPHRVKVCKKMTVKFANKMETQLVDFYKNHLLKEIVNSDILR